MFLQESWSSLCNSQSWDETHERCKFAFPVSCFIKCFHDLKQCLIVFCLFDFNFFKRFERLHLFLIINHHHARAGQAHFAAQKRRRLHPDVIILRRWLLVMRRLRHRLHSRLLIRNIDHALRGLGVELGFLVILGLKRLLLLLLLGRWHEERVGVGLAVGRGRFEVGGVVRGMVHLAF